MTFHELKRLVAQGESATLEFKRKVAHPDKIVKEMVAFANSDGGQLLIGVNDDGHISGVKYPEDEIYSLNQMAEKLCKPVLDFTIEEIEISEKATVIVYDIPKSPKRPHLVKDDDKANRGQVFVRYEDKSVKASREMREIIERRKKNKDIKFNFGDKEKVLMEHLNEHGTITLSQFREVAKLNYFLASKTLILLVLANVLQIIPTEKGDFYALKNIS